MRKLRIQHRGQLVTAYENNLGVIGSVCSRLKEFRPIEEFGLRKNGKHYYLTSRTVNQSSLMTRTYRDKNPEKRIYSSIRNRATRDNIDFNLTIDDIKIDKYCPILGIELDTSYGKRKENSVSVDRIDNSKGYVKGNIVLCSWRANRLKSSATIEEVEKIYLFMKTKLKVE